MSFNQIKGQDKAIQLLKRYLENGRLTGAFLFCGPEGVGKYATAMSLAQAVNCLQDRTDACGRCPSCIKIEKYIHPDVYIINVTVPFDPVSGRMMPPQQAEYGETRHSKKEDTPGRDIKIDYIRALRAEINLRPYEDGKKVFIINDAHNLTRDAQDAFLKTLEESSADSLIILISSKPSLLARTIISRCRVIRFGSLPRGELEEILKAGYNLRSLEAAHYAAYFSEGRMGRALRLAGTEDMLGEKNKVIDAFVWGGSMLKDSPLINKLEKANREEVAQVFRILTAWFRDLYVLKTGTAHQELINLDREDDLVKSLNSYSLEDLEEKIRFLSDSIFYLEHNLNVKLLLSNMRMELWKN